MREMNEVAERRSLLAKARRRGISVMRGVSNADIADLINAKWEAGNVRAARIS